MGTVFVAASPFAQVLERWLPALEESPARDDATAHLRFDLVIGAMPFQPLGDPRLTHGGVGLWRLGSEVVLAGPRGLGGQVDLDTGEGAVWAPPAMADGPWMAVHHILRPLWSLALGRAGLHSLHAASVELAGHGILVLGATRAGKSTLAARLAHEGARVISDDTSFVDRSATAVYGLGDRSRLASFPVPGYVLEPDPDGKCPGTVGRVTTGPARPALVLVLDPTPTPELRVRRLSSGDLMPHLLRSGLLTLDPEGDGQRLVALGRLAETCTAFSVSRGPRHPGRHLLRAWLRAAVTA